MQGILERKPVKVGLVLALLAILGWSVSPAIVTAEATTCDSELRHRINEIQNNPGPVTNQERNKIQDLRNQIDDNDDNDDDDNDDDDNDDD